MDHSKGMIIHDRETLKVMADPLRAQILEVLIDATQTIKQTAAKLGLSASKLYYHFNLLEQHGLIEVVETRQVGNLVEKHYRAVAPRFELAPGLLATNTEEGKQVANEMIISSLETTRDDILRSLQARYFQLEQGAPEHPRRMIINRLVSRLTEPQAAEFQDRLCTLLEEFEAAGTPSTTPEVFPYAFYVALYPSFYFEEVNNG